MHGHGHHPTHGHHSPPASGHHHHPGHHHTPSPHGHHPPHHHTPSPHHGHPPHHHIPSVVPIPIPVPVPVSGHHPPHHHTPPPSLFDRNRKYHIKSANPDAHPGFHLTTHSHYDTDKRGPKSNYVCIHKPGWKGCQWMIEQAGDGTYIISMGTETDYKQCIGRRLSGSNMAPTDHIDHMHARAILNEVGHPGDRWHIKQTPHGTYVLTLADGPLQGWQLAAKYPNNGRGGGKSFYVCLLRPGPHPEPHWAISAC